MKNGRKSVTAAAKSLVEFGAATMGFTARDFTAYNKGKKDRNPDNKMAEGYSVSEETFAYAIGKSVYGHTGLYVSCPDVATRRRLEQFMEVQGHTVDRGYRPDSSIANLEVKAFKGGYNFGV